MVGSVLKWHLGETGFGSAAQPRPMSLSNCPVPFGSLSLRQQGLRPFGARQSYKEIPTPSVTDGHNAARYGYNG